MISVFTIQILTLYLRNYFSKKSNTTRLKTIFLINIV